MEKVRIAGTPAARARGLMFEKQENFDYALVFVLPGDTALGASVHMLFVFFPIDIVFLDAGKTVVDKARLPPWTPNYTPKKPASFFVELPAGKADGIGIGDRLEWA